MKNKVLIHTDDVCIYINVSAGNPLYGKIVLLLADLVILSILITSLVLWIPALLLISAAFLFMMIRYTLWNFYGKENVIINTKSVSYQHDYVFIKTGYTTVPYNKLLTIQVAPIKPFEDKHLLLRFSTHDEDDLPIELYSMTLSIAENDASRLNNLTKQLFTDKVTEQYALPPIHLN